MTFDLSRVDIKFLPGVGPKRAELLKAEAGLASFQDLLYYFPYKYVDRSRLYRIKEIDGSMPYIQIRGRILSFETVGEGRRRRLVAHFTDGTGVIDLVWFQAIKYVINRYSPNEEYVVFGKPSEYGGRINIAHPEIDKANEVTISGLGLQPNYNTTEKMKRSAITSAAIQHMVANVLAKIDGTLPETLTPGIVAAHDLLPLDAAIRNIHFPSSPEMLRKAQFRLKFEELFYVQLQLLRYTKERSRKFHGFVFSRIGRCFNDFYTKCLPFELTGAQKRVLKEIRRDVGSGRQMNRLLQGDVGSGKTLVALMSMLMALDNSYQACIMAPTEILAGQHYDTISSMVAPIGINVALLTGSVKGKRRAAILQGLEDGTVDILVGTHAVLEDTVAFHSLGLVVIDEQHRFGVAQRARMWRKNYTPPHVLVMTATPIPRTLAMTLYGDLDVSVIDELPPGRKPVRTIHLYDTKRDALYRSVRQQLEEGRQVYFVYPLISESEKIDLKNLEAGYEQVCAAFPDYQVCKVHGQMKPAEKDEQMRRFVTRECAIMVATTVIEVGVNVPNASVMVIENAERFGLSQLHQLRGRVGRGADQSFCILVTKFNLSEDTRRRIQIMVDTNDGFEIAEADLAIRGPGDLEGLRQSGMAFDLKIANLARDGQILQLARDAARAVVDDDPACNAPANALLWREVERRRRETLDWSSIS